MDNKLNAFVDELRLIVEIKKSQVSNFMDHYQEGEEMWGWLHGKFVAFSEILQTMDDLYEKHK